MARNVVTVRPTTGFKEIVETLANHRLRAVPVVGEDDRVLGVVSEADLMHKAELAGDRTPAGLLHRKRVRTARAKANAGIAADLMTAPAVVIAADETVTTAAKLMDDQRIRWLPVADSCGRLVGVVTRSDVLRQYLRKDEAIRREILDEVLVRAMWIQPTALDVTVDRGVATLGGTLDRRGDIEIVRDLVRTVAGVVDVVCHLSYRYDDPHRPPRPKFVA
jgi:CBS-domain-containing membrane protein